VAKPDDFVVVGATAGLPSSVSSACTAGQASSGTQATILTDSRRDQKNHKSFGARYRTPLLIRSAKRGDIGLDTRPAM